jgi:acyl-CoA synthetase (AMP-forming)/AMP-acid ligase II
MQFPSSIPMQDILSLVAQHATQRADDLCVRWESRRTIVQQRTFAEIYAAAGRAAGYLHALGLKKGEVLVLVGTHHIDLYAVWLGAVWLGAIPTVLAEPSVRIDPEVYWHRLGELLHRIQAWGLASDPRVKIGESFAAGRRLLRYPEIAQGTEPPPLPVQPAEDDTLLLQHSSGTTGLHKGVMLSHGAVWRHLLSYQAAIGLNTSDRIVSWLPLYHDMGFIACFVTPLMVGIPVIWLSPFEWVANPAILLAAISEHRGTLSWLPNFAYEFLAQRVKADAGPYDLSSWRGVINCSEPVTGEAMEHFAARFSEHKFAATALQSCYAMAENVFAVTTTSDQSPPRRRTISRKVWAEEHRAVPSDDADALTHLSCGECVRDCELKIVDAQGNPLPHDQAGRILIRSPFLLSGYFRRDDLNTGLLDSNGFFDTGDLGYVDAAGHVYVTGRQKDLIIVGGKNIYPQDVETAAAEVPGVHPGRAVCFGVTLSGLGTEGLVLLVESDEPEDQWADLAAQLRTSIPRRLDLDIYDCRVAPRGELRKSTSGKLARGGNRQWYLAGRFGAISREIQTGDST